MVFRECIIDDVLLQLYGRRKSGVGKLSCYLHFSFVQSFLLSELSASREVLGSLPLAPAALMTLDGEDLSCVASDVALFHIVYWHSYLGEDDLFCQAGVRNAGDVASPSKLVPYGYHLNADGVGFG